MRSQFSSKWLFRSDWVAVILLIFYGACVCSIGVVVKYWYQNIIFSAIFAILWHFINVFFYGHFLLLANNIFARSNLSIRFFPSNAPKNSIEISKEAKKRCDFCCNIFNQLWNESLDRRMRTGKKYYKHRARNNGRKKRIQTVGLWSIGNRRLG